MHCLVTFVIYIFLYRTFLGGLYQPPHVFRTLLPIKVYSWTPSCNLEAGRAYFRGFCMCIFSILIKTSNFASDTNPEAWFSSTLNNSFRLRWKIDIYCDSRPAAPYKCNYWPESPHIVFSPTRWWWNLPTRILKIKTHLHYLVLRVVSPKLPRSQLKILFPRMRTSSIFC